MCRAGPAVAVAALLVLAGCGGVSVGAGTPTLTPAALPPTPTPTGTPPPDVAPGISVRGVADPLELAAAHRAALSNASYTLRRVETVRRPDGTVRGRTATTARVAAGGVPFHLATTVSGNPWRLTLYPGADRVEVYGTAQRRYLAVVRENGTRYAVLDRGGATAQVVLGLFLSVETRTVGTVRRNGTTHYRVESTGLRDPLAFAGAVNAGNGVTVRNVSVRALVSERGLVRAYAVAYTAERGGRAVRVTRRVGYRALGRTAVERPAWVAEAANATRDTGDR